MQAKLLKEKSLFKEGSKSLELYKKALSDYGRGRNMKHLAIAYEYVRTLTMDRVAFLEIKEISSYHADYFVCQMAHGDTDIMLGISGNTKALLYLAGGFGREEYHEINEDSYDALCEITNMINGKFAAMLEEESVELEIVPPVCCENCNITTKGSFYTMCLEVNGNRMDIISVVDVIPYMT